MIGLMPHKHKPRGQREKKRARMATRDKILK